MSEQQQQSSSNLDWRAELRLGREHYGAGHTAEARQSFLLIRRREADNPDALNDLALAMCETGQAGEAVEFLRRAIELEPRFVQAHGNLVWLLDALGRTADAIEAARHAAALCPDSPAVHLNFGNALAEGGRFDDAEAAYREAMHLQPNLWVAHNALGILLKRQGRIDEALRAYRAAVALEPDAQSAHSNLLFDMHMHPAYDAPRILREHLNWAAAHADPLTSAAPPLDVTDRSPDRRLRVGYVSPDFRVHPIARFVQPLLERHDREHFEVFCYGDMVQPDAMTDRLRRTPSHWRSITGMSDAAAAQLVRGDRIDILVDLALHSSRSRLLLFAHKPAPVQVSYLAYPGTSGMRAMDWRLTDVQLDPPGTEAHYSERPARLTSYWCYRPPDDAPPVGPLPAHQRGYVTFACLNNFAKVSDEALTAWAAVLRATANSRLLIHCLPGRHAERIGRILQNGGVAPDRIMLFLGAPVREYLAAYNQADIALDPFPFNGGTTTCDALWMGVPLVTFAGQTAVGRAGVSILNNAGLPELAAHDCEQYLAAASMLAADLPRLGELRSTMRARLQCSPLMDETRFVTEVQAAYRMMWHAYLGQAGAG